MTPEAQRIAIAEACGWVWYRIPKLPSDTREHRALFHPAIHEYPEQSERWKVRADGTERICNMEYMARDGHVPNYLNDLNAMHEAEKELSNEQCDRYETFLIRAATGIEVDWITGKAKQITSCQRYSFHATAAQRAEAFLKTIGKWTE